MRGSESLDGHRYGSSVVVLDRAVDRGGGRGGHIDLTADRVAQGPRRL